MTTNGFRRMIVGAILLSAAVAGCSSTPVAEQLAEPCVVQQAPTPAADDPIGPGPRAV